MTLEIDTQLTDDNIPILHLQGEIDMHTCISFRESLREQINNSRLNIVVDLAKVPYLDSTALGVLVDTVRRVREFDGSISLVAATPFVRRAFEITRLAKIFLIFDTEAQALESIRSRAQSPAAP